MTFLAVNSKKTHTLDLEKLPSLSISTAELFRLCRHSCLRYFPPHLRQKYLWRARRQLEKKFWSFKRLLSGNAKFVSWEKKIVFGKTKEGKHKTEPISDCERTKMEKVLFVGGGEWGEDNKGKVTGVLMRSEIQDYFTSRRSSSSKILDGGPNVTKSKSRVSWVRSRLQAGIVSQC